MVGRTCRATPGSRASGPCREQVCSRERTVSSFQVCVQSHCASSPGRERREVSSSVPGWLQTSFPQSSLEPEAEQTSFPSTVCFSLVGVTPPLQIPAPPPTIYATLPVSEPQFPHLSSGATVFRPPEEASERCPPCAMHMMGIGGTAKNKSLSLPSRNSGAGGEDRFDGQALTRAGPCWCGRPLIVWAFFSFMWP